MSPKPCRFQIVSLILVVLSASCATVKIPPDYVPDGEVVYLMQNTGFEPIRYEAVAADPYTFAGDDSAVDPIAPRFLKDVRFENLLKADFKADSRLYREAAAHFEYALKMPLFTELRRTLDAADIAPPQPLPNETGELVNEYSNAVEYRYPSADRATITIFDSGAYVITFADKSIFQRNPDGRYFWNAANGKTEQQYDPTSGLAMVKKGGMIYASMPGYRSCEGPAGKLEYNATGEPQYILRPAGKNAMTYTYFVERDMSVKSCSLKTATGIRFDYFPSTKSILATTGTQAIKIDADFRKLHAKFDEEKREPTDILSVYFPQGLRLTNLDTDGVGYAELNPAWPETYKMKQIGPFNVWYTAKDEQAIARLKGDRLTALESKVGALAGLKGGKRRALIIPPDLNAYRKLFVTSPGQKVHWYPSGFESLDYITMWPVSVPRYTQSAGQDYFFDQEIYEIIAHEYVHLLVGENSGVFAGVPVWLNEGLAVYVEAQLYPDAKKYWDTTFAVSRDLKRLLPWDDVTVRSTSHYPIAQARIHYAQSYALVSHLAETYGIAKVAAYVKSFRVKSAEYGKTDIGAAYKENYRNVFGVAWNDGKEILSPASAP